MCLRHARVLVPALAVSVVVPVPPAAITVVRAVFVMAVGVVVHVTRTSVCVGRVAAAALVPVVGLKKQKQNTHTAVKVVKMRLTDFKIQRQRKPTSRTINDTLLSKYNSSSATAPYNIYIFVFLGIFHDARLLEDCGKRRKNTAPKAPKKYGEYVQFDKKLQS